jgi:hypothetical protein
LDFCLTATVKSNRHCLPQRFQACAFTGLLKRYNIATSMDGRGRALDNIFVERL